MAFSAFGANNANTMAASGVQKGPGIEDIFIEGIGFLPLNNVSTVQLTKSWPIDNLPPPTASLMSIASRKGLIAAAGPDAVVVATTESARNTFTSGDAGKMKPFQPQLQLPMPMRISQLAFSADEQYLVLSAESGGGLAVYDVQSLLRGSTECAFQMGTNGQAVRALIPNPAPEMGSLFAIISADGNLMIANLKERSLMSGTNGQVLKSNVSCVSWSTKGKQLVAGLGDGTATQMTPEGVVKGEIPRPPDVDPACHVSSITWLENHVFILVHTPPSSPGQTPPVSIFHVVTRTPPSNFTFQNSPEPVGPFGMARSPPHQFVLRLREFPPNLQDLIIIASTVSTDIGLLSRSKVPLTKDKPADQITGVFTLTEMADDNRKALLPMTESLSETSPIGFAVDLSGKEPVHRPIPQDTEIPSSATPLPALMVLNHEGVLAAWWIIYSESIRQKTIYPGLVAAEGVSQAPMTASPAQPSAPAFGAPSVLASSFGGAQPAPAFGTSGGAFGAPSGLGQRSSVWGGGASSSPAAATSTPAFGSSSFGSKSATSGPASTFGSTAFGTQPTTSTPTSVFGASYNPTSTFGSSTFGAKPATPSAPAFGSSGLPGANRASPWGTAVGSAFGKPSGLGQSTSVFGSGAPSTGNTPTPASGGFASFASTGGFASAPNPSASNGSVFGAKPTTSVFGGSSTGAVSGASTGSPFGSSANKSEEKPAGLFGANNFSLGSTFKADKSTEKDEAELSGVSKGSFFGGTFGNALDSAAKAPSAQTPISKEADMDPEEPDRPGSTTPATTPAPPEQIPATGGLFGSTTPQTTTSVASLFGKPAVDNSKTGGFSFLNPKNTPASKPQTSTAQPPIISQTPPSPKIKEEPKSPSTDRVSEPPLPPDPTSKTSYAAGDTPSSSVGTDAPLPPDFIPKPAPKVPETSAQSLPTPAVDASKAPPTNEQISQSGVPGGPDDDGNSSGFETEEEGDEVYERRNASDEGSGEDVAQDLSPSSDVNETPGLTPETSFKGKGQGTMGSDLFTKISKPATTLPRGLFGEVGPAPFLPPPKAQVSPRSPSPVRSALPGRLLRPEATRSVSAPSVASQILSRKPPVPSQSTMSLTQQQQKLEEQRREEGRARKEAQEKQTLLDDEDERLQEFLASDIEGTRDLDEFMAQPDHMPTSKEKDNIASQVETVYRDINAMIDTLGVNARALRSFIKGHTEQYKEEGRFREDLHDEDDWCLVEIENLTSVVENQLGRELSDGRIQAVADKLETCNDLQKDLIRLYAKFDEVKRIRAAHSDGAQLDQFRSQPLSAEQAAQQNDLRRDFTNFQRLLSEAEEGLSVLKAKIVSQATSKGQSNGSAGPTVEAVMRTITKMTSMAEKRSGDIDVLEGHLRRLRFGSVERGSPSSREGSPLTTPQANRTSLRNPGTSSTYGLFYTPDSTQNTSRFQNSLMSSTSSRLQSSPPRKKLSGYTAEEKMEIREKFERKKKVTNRLRDVLKKSGTNVKLMDDDE